MPRVSKKHQKKKNTLFQSQCTQEAECQQVLRHVLRGHPHAQWKGQSSYQLQLGLIKLTSLVCLWLGISKIPPGKACCNSFLSEANESTFDFNGWQANPPLFSLMILPGRISISSDTDRVPRTSEPRNLVIVSK